MNPDESQSLVLTDFTNPKVRQQLRHQLRAAEWAMHQKVMAAAQTALDTYLSNPQRITAQDIAKLTQLGLDLGRSACGLAPGQPDETPRRGPFISLEFRTALEKAYGRSVPPEFIDADEVVPVAGPAPANEAAPTAP